MTLEEVFGQLGFNNLEAEVYIVLLRNGPQTAYRIGKLLGKPAANIYKAAEVLARAGAIEVSEADVRVCKAIPIQTVVKQLQSAYLKKMEQAVDMLGSIKDDTRGEGIYKLQTIDAVLERAREMLARAEQVTVVDAFPNALEQVKASINSAARKGVSLYVQAYEPVRLAKGISLVLPALAPVALQYWDAQQLNIAVDGKEILIALFNKDMTRLVQATYSNNLYLSCIVYSGIMNEHKVHQFNAATTMEEVQTIKDQQRFFHNSKVPGLDLLFNMYKKS